MAFRQCDAGLHSYNDEENDSCPMCKIGTGLNQPNGSAVKTPVTSATNKTQPLGLGGRTERIKPLDNTGGSRETQVISFDQSDEDPKNSFIPVAGWLVIVNGTHKGKDFRLIQGENKIGRNKTMEICLDFGETSDNRVSRDTHAIVVYDNHSNSFFAERGTSRNLPRINDQTIRQNNGDLSPNDIIQVGETKLMFVPLCGNDFKW